MHTDRPSVTGPDGRDLQPVLAEFARRFGSSSDCRLARAPGRVNLIGEHTDYNGLPVFPMALERGIELLFRARDDATVRVANLDPSFTPVIFSLNIEIPRDPPGSWGNYVRAAAQALARSHRLRVGLDGVIRSDLPIAAGVSSSSALVIASALALLDANQISVEPLELADLMARGERYVGTQGGGMDQAISLGARPGTAAVIEFEPLRLSHVPVPKDWRFIVADSLVRAEKSGSAQEHYNRRGRECRAALETVWREEGLDDPAGSYRDLLAARPTERILEVGERSLPDVLRRRFRHVVTEGVRVFAARDAMNRGDAAAFGRLMDQSHLSLARDYEVSRAKLDRLVEIARGSGAAGARLTGAGFGGCIVTLASEDRVSDVLQGLEREYYEQHPSPRRREDRLFVATPAAGASVTRVEAVFDG